jgi:hypothetical protein
MKVKAIVDYNDLQLNRRVKKGEEFEVTKSRATVLINSKVAVATTPTTAKGVKKEVK